MRRVLIAVLLASAFATAALAAPLTLGVHGGSSVPDLHDNGGNELSSGWSSRVGPFFGVSADLGLSPAWSVLAEVNWAPQGGKHNGMQAIPSNLLPPNAPLPPGQSVYASFKNEARLNYIEVPVLAQFHFGGLSNLRLAAGPYVGLLVSAREVTSGNGTVYLDKSGTMPAIPGNSFASDTDIKNSIHSFNWGLQAGVGTARPLGSGELTLDVRGGLGLTNIQKDAVDGKNGTGALVVTLGYAMPLGHPR